MILDCLLSLFRKTPVEPVSAPIAPEFPVKRKPAIKKATTRKPAIKKPAVKKVVKKK